MQGAPRRQAHSWARSFFLLPSVLALLALALFPVIAHAESSNEKVYETEIPSVHSEPTTNSGGHKTPHHNKASNNGEGETGRATGSTAGGVGTEESEGESGSGHKSKEGSSGDEEGNPSTAAGGGGDNKPNGGAGAGSSDGISGNKPVEVSTGVNASESGGGSSPVVPILIAIVVLAAISIGVVLYRQRRSGQGGSDGRVSSPNAS